MERPLEGALEEAFPILGTDSLLGQECNTLIVWLVAYCVAASRVVGDCHYREVSPHDVFIIKILFRSMYGTNITNTSLSNIGNML